MPITDHIIKAAPKLHSSLARAHNRLVGLLNHIQGTNGIIIKKTKGNILISYDPTYQDDSGGGGGAATVGAIGADGTLYNVTGTNVSLNTYPTFLRTLTSGKKVTLDSNGLEIDNNAGQTVRIFFTNVTHSMAVRTINVCNSGSPASMDIIASAPY